MEIEVRLKACLDLSLISERWQSAGRSFLIESLPSGESAYLHAQSHATAKKNTMISYRMSRKEACLSAHEHGAKLDHVPLVSLSDETLRQHA